MGEGACSAGEGFFAFSVGSAKTRSFLGYESNYWGVEMRYAILCYQAEGEVCAMSKEQDDAMMGDLHKAQAEAAKTVKFGPVARLMPTTAAMTVREGRELVVLDGPFAETKEQLLGFYVVDCASLHDALEAATNRCRGRRVDAGGRGQDSRSCRLHQVRPPS